MASSPFTVTRRKEEREMSKVCPITGKRPGSGNTVSKANNKNKRRFNPNLVSKRVWNPEEKRWVRMRISTKALKTLDKKGWVR
jgi:large subunit ribosomal protein L28